MTETQKLIAFTLQATPQEVADVRKKLGAPDLDMVLTALTTLIMALLPEDDTTSMQAILDLGEPVATCVARALVILRMMDYIETQPTSTH